MLGNQLRKVRQTMGLSIREMAELIGVDPSHLSRVERGQRNATADLVNRIDQRAAEQGLESHLGEIIGVEDETVRQLGRFLLDDRVSEAKKAAVRRMVHVLIRME